MRELEETISRMEKLLTQASDALDDGSGARPISLVIRIERELDRYWKALRSASAKEGK